MVFHLRFASKGQIAPSELARLTVWMQIQKYDINEL